MKAIKRPTTICANMRMYANINNQEFMCYFVHVYTCYFVHVYTLTCTCVHRKCYIVKCALWRVHVSKLTGVHVDGCTLTCTRVHVILYTLDDCTLTCICVHFDVYRYTCVHMLFCTCVHFAIKITHIREDSYLIRR